MLEQIEKLQIPRQCVERLQELVEAAKEQKKWAHRMWWTIPVIIPPWLYLFAWGNRKPNVIIVLIALGVSALSLYLLGVFFGTISWTQDLRRMKKEAGIAVPLAGQIVDKFDRYTDELLRLKRYISIKDRIELENTPQMAELLERKLARMTGRREQLMAEIELVNKLWGVRVNEFDDLSALFESDETDSSTREMLRDAFLRISSALETEDLLLDVERLDSARFRRKS